MATTLQAGAVAVNIVGCDKSVQEALKRVQHGFKGLAAHVRDFAVTFAAIDHVFRRWVVAPFRSAITEFTKFGDTYAKMSRRVGMGAKDLSLLGYAAEQTGASVSALDASFRYLNRNLAAAGQGNKAAKEAFANLGLNLDQLQTLKKKDQFLTIADAIRRLGDEAKQTDAAMKIFGRGGTSMLPMFQEGRAGIQALMQEADKLGIGISDEDAAKAEVLSSSITRMQQSLQGLRRTIISSFVEPVTKLIDDGSRLIRWMREWISANPTLTRSLMYVSGAATLGSAAFMGWRFIAPMFKGLLVPIKTFGTVSLGVLKSVWAFFLSPPSASVKSFGNLLKKTFIAALAPLNNFRKVLWTLLLVATGKVKLLGMSFGSIIIKSFVGPLMLTHATAKKTGMSLFRAFLNPIPVIKKFATVLWGAVKAVALFVSPWVLLKVAVAGAVGAILYFTGVGSRLMSWLGGFAGTVRGTFSSAFGDVAELIQEGRILDAVRLLWLKIQLFFEEGKLAIVNKWNEVAAAISEPFLAIYDAIASAVKPAVEWLVDTFHGIGGWIYDQFAGPLQGLMDWFGWLWNSIKGGWDALMNDLGYVIVGAWWTIATGINDAIAWIRNAWNDLLTGIQEFALTFAKNLINTFTSVARALDFTGIVSSTVNAANKKIDEMIANLKERGEQKGLDIEADRKSWQDYFDKTAEDSLGKVDAVKANAPQTNDRIETLKLQIAELRKPPEASSRARQIADTAQAITKGGASSIIQGTMNKQDILGGALAYMASEKDHSEDIADNTERIGDILERIERKEGGLRYT